MGMFVKSVAITNDLKRRFTECEKDAFHEIHAIVNALSNAIPIQSRMEAGISIERNIGYVPPNDVHERYFREWRVKIIYEETECATAVAK